LLALWFVVQAVFGGFCALLVRLLSGLMVERSAAGESRGGIALSCVGYCRSKAAAQLLYALLAQFQLVPGSSLDGFQVRFCSVIAGETWVVGFLEVEYLRTPPWFRPLFFNRSI
jgi:hypothetical protein